VPLWLAVMATLLSSPSEATTVLHHRLDGLVRGSGLIVEGTVMEVMMAPGDEDNVPTTTYRLCDLDLVVGDHTASCLDITVPGGTDDGVRHGGFVGMPELQVGGRYLLFLRKEAPYTSPFVGWWQGVYRIVDGQRGPAVLSHGGHAVRRIAQDGEIETKRDVRIVQTSQGPLTFESDHPAVDVLPAEAASQAISRGAFVEAIQMTATSLMLSGEQAPQRLPQGWTCRTHRRAKVAMPPVETRQEVSP